MDLERLQGTWRNGAATITVNGDRFTTAQMGAEYTGRVELNESVTPKAQVLHFETGPEAGNTNYGIYEFAGEEWRFSLNITGGPAPKEFVAVQTMVRRQPPAAPIGTVPVSELQGKWAMLSCVRAGDPLPASFAKQGKRTIAGTQSTLYFGPQLFMQGTLSRDGPGAIRLQFSSGEAPQLGIFELVGDKLKTCMSAFGQQRPTAYASSKEGGETYAVWKRR